MKVTLTTEKTIVVREAETKLVTELTVHSITDNPTLKKVTCVTREVGLIVLWEGAAYDAIGQWKDSDVTAKLLSIYN